MLTRKGRTVDRELHRKCGFIDSNAFQSHRSQGVSNRVADFRIGQTDDSHNITGTGFFSVRSSQIVIQLDLIDFGEFLGTIGTHQRNLLTRANSSGSNSSGGNTADIA